MQDKDKKNTNEFVSLIVESERWCGGSEGGGGIVPLASRRVFFPRCFLNEAFVGFFRALIFHNDNAVERLNDVYECESACTTTKYAVERAEWVENDVCKCESACTTTKHTVASQ